MGTMRRGPVDRLVDLGRQAAGSSLDRGTLLFRTLVTAIIVVGVIGIAMIRDHRQLVLPTTSDSWVNTLSVFDCRDSGYVDPVATVDPATGLRWRTDGRLSIEPLTDDEAGSGATLGRVFAGVGGHLDDAALSFGETELRESEATWCAGEEVILQVHRWTPTADEPEITVSDLGDVRLRGDDEQILVALAPIGARFDRPAIDV